ncbi:MAG: hypothetical protein BRC23_02505 [Parcubacteria group bacterium SW_4_49_11]|nr:MAG: hypothetical protein BRC23_02505 [Parcubacteria group bacterium SW_4_49_11]
MPVLPESYTDGELKSITQNLLHAIEGARPGEMSQGVSSIPNPLPPQTLVEDGEAFQIMVVGGTTFQSARARFTNGELVIDETRECELPLLETRQTFLSLIETYIEGDISVLALNYSFPIQAFVRDNRLDGTALRSVKHHQLEGLLGQPVGQEIEDYLNPTREYPLSVTCAHDTTSLLLAGRQHTHKEHPVGGVIGTGMNFAFLEDERVINLESGNFSDFPQTETGKRVDAESDTSGEQQFEKEVAGAFLPWHYNIFVKEHSSLDGEPISDAAQLSELAENGDQFFQDIARRLMRRSARLAACQMAALFHFRGREHTTFIMEGSLFWEGWKYRQTITRTLKLLDVPSSAIRFVYVPNSSLLGAGQLVRASHGK